MRRWRTWAALVFTALAPVALVPHAAGAVTLAQCLDLARTHAPALAQAEADVARAQGAIHEAGAARQPTLHFDASYVQNTQPEEQQFSLPGLPPQTIKIGAANILDLKTVANYTLFSSGLNPARVRAAQAGEQAQQSARDQADADLTLRVSQAFYRELGAQRLIFAANEALVSARSHLRVAKARVQAGVSPKLDALRADVDASEREVELARAQEARAVAHTDLESAIGMALDPADTLVAPPLPESAFPDSAAALRQALAARPEIASLDHQIAQAREQAQAAHAEHLPQVNLSGTAEYRAPNKNEAWANFNDPGLRTYNLFAGVELSMPILDGGLSGARVEQYDAQRIALEARRRSQTLTVQQDVAQALSDLRIATVQWQTIESRLASATEAVRLSEETYKGGAGAATDVIDAVSDLATARVTEAQALLGYWSARAELDHAMGKER
jgi:outer membrane protein TolC